MTAAREAPESRLVAVRELHAPEDHSGRLECNGCDFEGYEAECPQWPCRTAELVYTAEEIADVTSAHRWWAAWGRERERRRRLASGWTEDEGIAQWLNRALLAQLQRPLVTIDGFAVQPDTITVNKVGHLMTVSREMLK